MFDSSRHLAYAACVRVTLREKRLLKDYKRLLQRALGPRLKAYRLFGSWARGDATDESDVDVLVVVKDLYREEKNRLLDRAYDLSLTRNRYLSPMIVDRAWYAELVHSERLLAKEIAKDGIDL